MAGISAVSASKSAAASGADVAVTGFLVGERIALSTTPTGNGYQWAMAAPSDSAPARSALDDDTDGAPTFIPDVAGYYVLSVTVDGSTTYVLRIAVASVATVRVGEVLHLLPLADSQVSTPQAGVSFYYSTDAGKAVVKDTTGTVTPLY